MPDIKKAYLWPWFWFCEKDITQHLYTVGIELFTKLDGFSVLMDEKKKKHVCTKLHWAEIDNSPLTGVIELKHQVSHHVSHQGR